MPRSHRGLLQQIEDGALDSSYPLADTLRKCVALGGRADSTELRDWARRELGGYHGKDDLPDYRQIPAILAIDGVTMISQITQQQISPSQLPEFAQGVIKEQVDLRDGVGGLEDLVKTNPKGRIRLTVPMGADLAHYMTAQSGLDGQAVTSIYYVISTNSVVSVLDQIRTNLTSLVAEMRSLDPQASDLPSSDAASQAVNVVIHGGKRNAINVNNSQIAGSPGSTTKQENHPESPDRSNRFDWVKGPWGFAVGLGSIASGIAGVAVWQGWGPF